MKHILALAATGFEDVELITTLDVLERDGIKVTIASPENKTEVKGIFNAIVKTIPLQEVYDLSIFHGIFLPGGKGYQILLEDENVLSILRHFNEAKKVVAAICAAPDVLIKSGIVNERKITSHPKHGKIERNTGADFEVDENLVTGKGMETTLPFAKELVARLKI